MEYLFTARVLKSHTYNMRSCMCKQTKTSFTFVSYVVHKLQGVSLYGPLIKIFNTCLLSIILVDDKLWINPRLQGHTWEVWGHHPRPLNMLNKVQTIINAEEEEGYFSAINFLSFSFQFATCTIQSLTISPQAWNICFVWQFSFIYFCKTIFFHDFLHRVPLPHLQQIVA